MKAVPAHDSVPPRIRKIIPENVKMQAGAKCQGCSSPFECQAEGAHVSQVFPMMRRLLDAVVRHTVSYGCKVWGPACPLALGPELKDMLGVQMAFLRQLCQLRKSVTPDIIFKEFSERPWLDTWWSFLLRLLPYMQS